MKWNSDLHPTERGAFIGADKIKINMRLYGARIKQIKVQIAQYMQPIVEADAKQNAPWGDVTGNARQSLYAVVEQYADDAVRLYLSHGVEYGVYLELANQGRYAIILPTMEKWYPEVMRLLKAVLH